MRELAGVTESDLLGAVVQLGERHVRNVEVAGSTPACSNKPIPAVAGIGLL